MVPYDSFARIISSRPPAIHRYFGTRIPTPTVMMYWRDVTRPDAGSLDPAVGDTVGTEESRCVTGIGKEDAFVRHPRSFGRR